jgi:predicted enzyme related to lactoylglutathione lyase
MKMLKIQDITIDCQNPTALAHFWAQALDWKIGEDGTEKWAYIEKNLTPTNSDGYPSFLFYKTPDKKSVKNRMHLDLRPENQMEEVERLEKIGATRIEIGQSSDPSTTWIVMADPEGNEFCVLKGLG